jgi:hypothetical protein
VYEIDRSLIGDPDGFIPPEAIHGGWRVDEHGRLTGEYVSNPDYGPPQDDFSKLNDADGWIGWLGEDPGAVVRDAIAGLLSEQVAAAQLEWVKILDAPRYLTGFRRTGHADELILTRCAIALRFALAVSQPRSGREILWGVFTWASRSIDEPDMRSDRLWLDLRADLDSAEEQLKERIYSDESAPENQPRPHN